MRLLESLLRLAEAHARLMFREDVLMEDAIVAILCISQAQSIGTLSAKMNDAVREDFAVNPQQQHRAHEEAVMKMLHYSRERLTQDSQSAYSGGEREPEVAQILTADIQARRDRFRKGVLERVEAMQAANKRARPSEAAGRDEPDRVSAQVPTPSLPSRSMIRNTSLQPSRYEEASSSSTVSMSMPVPAQSPLSGGNYDEHGVWASRSAEVAVHPQAAPTVIRSGSQIEQSVLSSSQNSSQTSIAASAGSSKPKRGIWGSASTTLALFGNDMEESL